MQRLVELEYKRARPKNRKLFSSEFKSVGQHKMKGQLQRIRLLAVLVGFSILFESVCAKECSSNAECVLIKCPNPGETSFCESVERECKCMTYDAYEKMIKAQCQKHCAEAYPCTLHQKGACDSYDPNANQPGYTFKCSCIPFERDCATKAQCPTCAGGKSDQCVDGKCKCLTCSGPCKDPNFGQCPARDEVPTGCGGKYCNCQFQPCKVDGDCKGRCATTQRQVCDKRYGSSVCSICLLKTSCVVNRDCKGVSGKHCCVYGTTNENRRYGTCLSSPCEGGPDGHSTGKVKNK